jgi:general stress protein 26
MNKEVIDRACEIIAGKAGRGNDGHCVLALIDKEGYPTASTISVSKADGMSFLTFCTDVNSNKVHRIRACNHASVCFSSAEYNITLVGTVEILTDTEIKKEMWYDGLEGHFSGADDPTYCVLRFKTLRYNVFVDFKEMTGTL